MNVPNHEKKAFRDMTPEERSGIVEAWLVGSVEVFRDGVWKKSSARDFFLDDGLSYRTRPRQLVIPWEHIKPEYKWAALDSYGNTHFYREKPEFTVADCFASKYGFVDVVKILNINTTGIDWRESLTARPEGV